MRPRKITLILLLALPLLTEVFVTNAHSGFKGSPSSPMSGFHYHPAPLPLPPQVPPARFSYVWSSDDVMTLLEDHGLDVYKASVQSTAPPDNMPAGAKEVRKFTLSSPEREWEGMIMSFELIDHLGKIRNYYLELNDSGKLNTWSFMKANILLVLPGSIPEEIARKYERALNSLPHR